MRRLSLALMLFIACISTGSATVHNISIVGLDFSPADITISQGDTVRWTNLDGVIHTSTSDALIWNSGFLGTGQSYARQFNDLGTFPYHCTLHPTMTDTITVELANDVETGDNPSLPKAFQLRQNHPNPFNASTVISYVMPAAAEVTITIYNILGQRVKRFEQGKQSPGEHSLIWDGTNAAGNAVGTGVYFYKLEAGVLNQVRKMTFIK